MDEIKNDVECAGENKGKEETESGKIYVTLCADVKVSSWNLSYEEIKELTRIYAQQSSSPSSHHATVQPASPYPIRLSHGTFAVRHPRRGYQQIC